MPGTRVHDARNARSYSPEYALPRTLRFLAALGDIEAVRRALDENGWGPLSEQRVLDVALAWSVINSHLDVAAFLLQPGADINTTWSSHELASILHELVWRRNYEAMQFLIDRGIDMTIRDHRWNGTVQGWAEYAAEDPKLAPWLEEAERQRELRR